MRVIVDVIPTVAMEALTTGAVPEFQLRIANICSSADCAPMGIRRFHRGGGGFIGTCRGEGDGFSLSGSLAGLSAE